MTSPAPLPGFRSEPRRALLRSLVQARRRAQWLWAARRSLRALSPVPRWVQGLWPSQGWLPELWRSSLPLGFHSSLAGCSLPA